jgi:hypothetical protein
MCMHTMTYDKGGGRGFDFDETRLVAGELSYGRPPEAEPPREEIENMVYMKFKYAAASGRSYPDSQQDLC